jgi:histidinol dehydrogenase
MPLLTSYGGLFVGPGAAEVFGDYGIGPNHTLPTSGSARFASGLSVLHFLRFQTYYRAHAASAETGAIQDLIRQTATLARLEGLEGHARAAESRIRSISATG